MAVGEQAVVVQRVAAEPDEVFTAWTDAGRFARWWWPHLPDTHYELDAREGGAYLIQSQQAGIGIRGSFVELDRPRLIRFTWTWLNDGNPVEEEPVSVQLGPVDGGTLVTVTHGLADLPDHAEPIRLGWVDVLGRLAALFSR